MLFWVNPHFEPLNSPRQKLDDSFFLVVIFHKFVKEFKRVNDPVNEPGPTCVQTLVTVRKRRQALSQKVDRSVAM